jgi:hypothetical protein
MRTRLAEDADGRVAAWGKGIDRHNDVAVRGAFDSPLHARQHHARRSHNLLFGTTLRDALIEVSFRSTNRDFP